MGGLSIVEQEIEKYIEYLTTVKKSSGTTKSTSDADVIVYVTKTGSKYHTKKCGNGTFTESTLEAAKKRGLEPCSKCYK